MTTNADHAELEGLLRLRYAEIEELKAEVGALTAALREIADSDLASPVMYGTEMREIARAALEGKP